MEKVRLARQYHDSVLCAEFVVDGPITRRWRLKVFHADTATIESLLALVCVVLFIWVSHCRISIHWTASASVSNLFTGGAFWSGRMTVVHFPQGLKLFYSDSS